MNKKEMRAIAHEKRSKIAQSEVVARGKRFLCELTKNAQYLVAETIFCYISMENEASTVEILDDAVARGKCVCVPVCLTRQNMIARRYTGAAGLVGDKYDIPAPPPMAGEIAKEEIDFAIIPCVACGRDFSRIGHGAGFYDRFLSGTKCIKIALCQSETLFESVPTDERDISMDGIITENASYYAEDGINARK